MKTISKANAALLETRMAIKEIDDMKADCDYRVYDHLLRIEAYIAEAVENEKRNASDTTKSSR